MLWEIIEKSIWRIVSRKSKEKHCINVSIETSIGRHTIKKRCCKGRLKYIYIIYEFHQLCKNIFWRNEGEKEKHGWFSSWSKALGEEFEALLKQCNNRMGEETWQKERLRPKNITQLAHPKRNRQRGRCPQNRRTETKLASCKPCDKVHRTQVA